MIVFRFGGLSFSFFFLLVAGCGRRQLSFQSVKAGYSPSTNFDQPNNKDDGCRNDFGCQLNGICIDRKCVCDGAWVGSNCEYLNFLPSTNHVAYHGPTSNSTSWGGSVLSVPSNLVKPLPLDSATSHNGTSKIYVMYVSEMVNECGLREWKTNSAVAVATSSHPEGPYLRQKQIISTWAHNPQAIQIESIDKKMGNESFVWAVFTLGDGDEQPVNGAVKDCTNNSKDIALEDSFRFESFEQIDEYGILQESRQLRGGYDASIDMSNTTVFFTIHYSTESPLGPFEKHRAAIEDFPVRFDFPGNWNPAPIVLPDGSVRIMVHTNYPKMWSGGVIVEASHWKGPYRPVTADVTHCVECQEDPFLWIDHRGHWHALFHRMFDPINKTQEEEVDSDDKYYMYDNYDGHHDKNKPNPIPSPGWVGGHSFSVDGRHWSNITRCFNTTVRFQDGSSIEMMRRERPKLIFDPNDPFTPTHLVNGVLDTERGTYTIVTPLNR